MKFNFKPHKSVPWVGLFLMLISQGTLAQNQDPRFRPDGYRPYERQMEARNEGNPSRGPRNPKEAPPKPTRLIVKLKPELSQPLRAQSSRGGDPRWDGPSNIRSFAANHSILRLEPLIPAPLLEAFERTETRFPRRSQRASLNAAQRSSTSRAPLPDLSRLCVVEVEGDLEKALAKIKKDPRVEYAEVDAFVKIQQATGPFNDPYLTQNDQSGTPMLWGHHSIRASEAWKLSTGKGVVVAVLDTGVDATHPDIKDNLWVNPKEIPGNGIDDDGNGFVDDVNGLNFSGDADGHGTHVAGTIGATGNNGIGMIGVAPDARIMCVNIYDRYNNASLGSVCLGFVYAATHGADVVNCSFGVHGYGKVWHEVIQDLYNKGIVVVAAAGNDSDDVMDFCPANLPEVICVAAHDSYSDKAVFSNHGTRIDVAAPGEGILSLKSTQSAPDSFSDVDDLYAEMRGTSMAAPHVSGVAALLLAQAPTRSVETIRQIIKASAGKCQMDKIGTALGVGRLDAATALYMGPVMETHISEPSLGACVTKPFEVRGIAQSPGFESFELEWGLGRAPEDWNIVAKGTTPVSNGPFAIMDPHQLPEGPITLRLSVRDQSGRVFKDHALVEPDFVDMISPSMPLNQSCSMQFKPGNPISIQGRVELANYSLEWAPGICPESGWQAFSHGTGPINGHLGSWTPDALLQGYCTLRIRAEDGGISRMAMTVIHLEPALLGPLWPKPIHTNSYENGWVYREDGNGNPELDLLTGSEHLRFKPDGTDLKPSYLRATNNFNPVVAELDPMPGSEILYCNKDSGLHITNEGITIKNIPLEGYTAVSSPVISEIKGCPALIVMGKAENKLALFAFRPDGTPSGANFPIVMEDGSPRGVKLPFAEDIDGTGEIQFLVAIGTTPESFTIKRFSEDGQSLPWNHQDFKGSLKQMILADLDRNGSLEVLIATSYGEFHCIQADGSPVKGWEKPIDLDPIHHIFPGFSVGDLDGDGREELVFLYQDPEKGMALNVLSADGTPWSSTFPISVNTSGGQPPMIADINGDEKQEILLTGHGISGIKKLLKPEIPGSWFDSDFRLMAIGLDGKLVQEWPMNGMGRKPTDFSSLFTLGDFNKDGKTEIALSFLTSSSFFWDQSVTTVLTTSAPWQEGTHDWPCMFGDSNNSSTLRRKLELAIQGAVPGNPVLGKVSIVIKPINLRNIQEVWLELDGKPLGSVMQKGPYIIPWDALSSGLGSHTLKAFARNASGVVIESASKSIEVAQKSKPGLSLTFIEGRNPSPYGQALTLQATLQSPDATGNLTLALDGTALPAQAPIQGKATWELPTNLSVGNHSLVVSYPGDNWHEAAQAQMTLGVIANSAISFTITQGSLPTMTGNALTVEASVQPASATGVMTFVVDGTASAPIPLIQGKASWSAPADLSVGTHNLTATYSGDGVLNGSTSQPWPIQVCDFSIQTSTPELKLVVPGSASLPITLTPQEGFDGSVEWSCEGLPNHVQAAFSNAEKTPDGGFTSTLTLTAKPSKSKVAAFAFGGGILGLGCLGSLSGLRRRRKALWAGLAASILGLVIIACGGKHSTPPPAPSPIPVTTRHTLTLVAKRGEAKRTCTVTLSLTE